MLRVTPIKVTIKVAKVAVRVFDPTVSRPIPIRADVSY
jgi:hypothetical protein